MKKYISILLIAIMLLSFAGCSSEEFSMYSLMSEMSKLKIVESTNIISFSMKGKLMDDTLAEIPGELEELKKILQSGFDLKIVSKVKKNPYEGEASIEFRKTGETEFTKVTTIITDQKKLFIKIDDLLKFVRPLAKWDDPNVEKTIDEIISKVEYVRIDLDSLLDKEDKSAMFDVSEINSDKISTLVDGFKDTFKEALKDYSTKAVSKKDNGYELKLTPKDLKPMFIDLVNYISNNIDHITNTLKKKVNSLTDDEMKTIKSFAGEDFDKATMISGLDEFRSQVKQTPKEDIEELENDPSFDDAIKSIEGSSLNLFITKTDSGSYESNTSINIQYEDQVTSNITVASKSTELAEYQVVYPTKSTTPDELNEIVFSIVEPKVNKVTVKLKSKEANLHYNNGKDKKIGMSYISKDGSTYLPLRKVGEALGEDVAWDNNKKVAYVMVDGKKTIMKGINNKGTVYIKIRDFEKLGYIIDWDGQKREVLINKKGFGIPHTISNIYNITPYVSRY